LNTILDYPKNNALGTLISEQAYLSPERIAVKFGVLTVTYKNLNERVNQLAGYLIDRDIKVGDKVGLCMDRSIDMVVSLLAIMQAGAAYVPLDPNFPADRLNFMLTDSGASLLLAAEKYRDLFQSETTFIAVEDALAASASYAVTNPGIAVCGSDLSYILYTSGSTGLPKGVQIEHHSLVNFLLSMQIAPGLTPADVLLSVTTISFDIAGLELYLPLITGALLIIADADSAKDGRVLLNMVRAEKVTVMQATPYTWRMMLAAGWDEKLPLKVLCGGEALPKKLADNLLHKCAELWNMYGPTETTIWSTIKKIANSDEIITIGRPIHNTGVYILNELLQPVSQGEAGEICIGGDGVARGYLNRPDLNADRFVNDGFAERTGQKMYRTGDMGRLTANGEIFCMGRMDHQVKIRGFRIEIEEIEHNLTNLHNINEAIVVIHTDAMENQRLIAYIQLKKRDLDIDLNEYAATWNLALKGKLPEYMLPNDYFLIADFPLTPNGKIDRKALPEPVFETNANTAQYVAPFTNTEKMLADIWMNCLGIKHISVTDNFFQLGGHSIIAVQTMVLVEKRTGQRLPIATLFEHPTIQQLAQWVDNTDKKTIGRSLVRIKVGGTKMPLYIIHGEGLNLLIFNSLATNMHPEQPIYGLQAIGLNGTDEPLDNIPDIAASYNAEILQQNPTGPYAIAGYSLGGYIAAEMVKQLTAMGKEVIMLAMIDTNLKPFDGYSKTGILFKKIKRQCPKTVFLFRSFFNHPTATLAYQGLIIKAKITETLAKVGVVKAQPEHDIPDYMKNIIIKLRTAIFHYRPTPYNGKIYLFKAKTRIFFIDDPEYLGWEEYALKGVVVNEVPGDHKVMLLPPNDKVFAKKLQGVLNELAEAY
jgi:amino acid adenylation domain-containing protein